MIFLLSGPLGVVCYFFEDRPTKAELYTECKIYCYLRFVYLRPQGVFFQSILFYNYLKMKNMYNITWKKSIIYSQVLFRIFRSKIETWLSHVTENLDLSISAPSPPTPQLVLIS